MCLNRAGMTCLITSYLIQLRSQAYLIVKFIPAKHASEAKYIKKKKKKPNKK